jgi:hypothetical protein
MYAFARRQPLRTLAGSLLKLDKPRDEAERLTRAVLIDVICEKSPAASAAFDRWAESDEPTPEDPRATQLIAAAALGDGPDTDTTWPPVAGSGDPGYDEAAQQELERGQA